MLKGVRLCKKFQKRKLERNVMAYLVAGKILRGTEIKFEITVSELSLLLKNNIMQCYYHVTYAFQSKSTLSLAKCLSVRLRAKCLWVRIPLLSLNIMHVANTAVSSYCTLKVIWQLKSLKF